jgi:addiction module HigA family antidote
MSKSIDRAREDAGEIDFSDVAVEGALSAVTPGDVLLEEFMRPFSLSARAVARDLGVPANRVTEIFKGERSITADTAIINSFTTPACST